MRRQQQWINSLLESAVIVCVLVSSTLFAGIGGEPLDKGVSNSTFVEFRRELFSIIEQKDTKRLLNHVHPRITSRLDGDGGVAEFMKFGILTTEIAFSGAGLNLFYPMEDASKEMVRY